MLKIFCLKVLELTISSMIYFNLLANFSLFNIIIIIIIYAVSSNLFFFIKLIDVPFTIDMKRNFSSCLFSLTVKCERKFKDPSLFEDEGLVSVNKFSLSLLLLSSFFLSNSNGKFHLLS